MIDVNNYIDDGIVDRTRITQDIKNRVMTHAELVDVVNDPRIEKSFFGTDYSGRKDKSHWNEEYLRCLTLASVGEVFNRQYLFHLEEVAAFVAESPVHKRSNRAKILLAVAGVVALVLIVFLLTHSANAAQKNECAAECIEGEMP